MVIRRKPSLGQPYTAEPDQVEDLDKPIKKNNEADPNQITEEFPQTEDSVDRRPDLNDM